MLLTPQPVTTLSAIYPRTYDPTYATGCCVLAVLLASAFSLIFPLLAPGALVLLFLTLIGTFDYLKISMNSIEKITFRLIYSKNSTPFPDRLRVRTHAFANRRFAVYLDTEAIRNYPRVPTFGSWPHFAQPKIMDRGRDSVRGCTLYRAFR